MVFEGKNANGKNNNSMERFTIQLTDSMMYDRLHTLSDEYSLPIDVLVNAAVKRLIDDVDFVRNLRNGKIEL